MRAWNSAYSCIMIFIVSKADSHNAAVRSGKLIKSHGCFCDRPGSRISQCGDHFASAFRIVVDVDLAMHSVD